MSLCLFGTALLLAGRLGAEGRLPANSKNLAKAGAVKTAGRVDGKVMKSWTWPADGRQVFLKGHEPVTIRDGAFSFANVPATYDLWIADPGGKPITVYYGLTRRDPVLMHGSAFQTALDEPSRKATVTGLLKGDFPFPLQQGYTLTVFYFSDRTRNSWNLGQPFGSAGPRFGRVSVRWNGEPTIDGNLVALGQHGSKERPWMRAFMANKSLSLVDKGSASEEMVLAPLPIGRIAGSITVLGKRLWHGDVQFRLWGNRGEVERFTCIITKAKYDCEIPDLSTLGGEYCLILGEIYGHGDARKCGGKMGMKDFSATLEVPPEFVTPGKNATITKQTVLSWTGDEKAVYLVEISPDFRPPTGTHLEVYTTETRLKWPDWEAVGIKAPMGKKFTCRVSRMVPYTSMDDLASMRGPISSTVDYQRVTSSPIEVTLEE